MTVLFLTVILQGERAFWQVTEKYTKKETYFRMNIRITRGIDLSVRAVLAHEYYGHRPYREQYLRGMPILRRIH